MSKEDEFERRLAAVEQAVADLQRRLADVPDPNNWLDKVVGSISDVEAFDEALKYGASIAIRIVLRMTMMRSREVPLRYRPHQHPATPLRTGVRCPGRTDHQAAAGGHGVFHRQLP